MKALVVKRRNFEASRLMAEDISEALRENGVDVWIVDNRTASREEAVSIASSIGPDFIWSFDTDELFCDGAPPLFETLKIPMVSHFINHPLSSYARFRRFTQSKYWIAVNCSVDYIDYFRELGKDDGYHVAHAASVRRIPTATEKKYDVSFCGYLFFTIPEIQEKICARFGRVVRNGCEKIVRIALECPKLGVFDAIALASPSYYAARKIQSLRRDEVEEYLQLVFWLELWVRNRSRIEVINAVKSATVHVFGDQLWERQVGDHVSFHGEIPPEETFRVYGESRIVLDISRPQLQGGVNNRMFEAILCGALVLTDSPYFNVASVLRIGEEVDRFSSSDLSTLDRMIAYYIKDHELREQIALRGKERIMKEHTWTERMAGVIKIVQKHRDRLGRLERP